MPDQRTYLAGLKAELSNSAETEQIAAEIARVQALVDAEDRAYRLAELRATLADAPDTKAIAAEIALLEQGS